ncbi:ABC transporter ATP-binding protein [Herbidospora galbida]|uniref:ABC transporter ATP-binding protein n=1 Tax=Herbidospora galbida TaxID=2575442 RepID=A0A4U3M9W2_9ACTN|nr:ABC transporter ATP-binding protein [Herbidospora galbida]TKK84874.1 ABC transporter ATP-binding protein [Herbidospora galbida]
MPSPDPGDDETPAHSPAIELRAVTRVYRDRPALGPIDLAIPAGEFLTVVGPSGCGKSTLLSLVAGFAPPTAGTVLADGAPVRGPGPSRGVVFQQPRLFPWLSVSGNIAFGLRRLPKAARKERVAELLAMTGLENAARLKPYELSGGMRQRAAIARALAPRPKVLLMDEPFGALDAFTRERMQEEIRDLWRSTGVTVLFITHDVTEASTLGTRVIALAGPPGRISLDARVSEGLREKVEAAIRDAASARAA